MPELPEVERFRQILLPLVTVQKKHSLDFKLYGEKLPRKWVGSDEVDSNTGKYCCVEVLRKGKQLCMVLESIIKTTIKGKEVNLPRKYFYLHMGMTGRLVSTTMSCSWGHKYIKGVDLTEEWPPRFTYLTLTSGGKEVAFADPRKFGSCKFGDSLEESFDELAPDGLTETITPLQRETMVAKIANQRLGIKGLILDQKRAVSGVGNWVADEVMYQCEMHPDQSYLTDQQAFNVVEKLHSILFIAVDCLNQDIPYPDKWLFGFRWTKKKAGKDYHGRSLSFLQSGGRTSAIVATIQKLRKSQGKKTVTSTEIKDEQKEKKSRNRNTKRKASSEGLEKKIPVKIIAPTGTKEVTSFDNKNGGVILKKRRVNIKVEEETKNKYGKSSRSTSKNIDKVAKGHTPDEVYSAVSPISSSSIKDPRKKLQKKLVKKKNERKRQDQMAIKQENSRSSSSINLEKTTTNIPGTFHKEAVKDFSLEKKTMLRQVDKTVRNDFRKVGFAKWQRSWLPIIQIGPYDISPGPVRNSWMKIFEKVCCISFFPQHTLRLSDLTSLLFFEFRLKKRQDLYIGMGHQGTTCQTLFLF